MDRPSTPRQFHSVYSNNPAINLQHRQESSAPLKNELDPTASLRIDPLPNLDPSSTSSLPTDDIFTYNTPPPSLHPTAQRHAFTSESQKVLLREVVDLQPYLKPDMWDAVTNRYGWWCYENFNPKRRMVPKDRIRKKVKNILGTYQQKRNPTLSASASASRYAASASASVEYNQPLPASSATNTNSPEIHPTDANDDLLYDAETTALIEKVDKQYTEAVELNMSRRMNKANRPLNRENTQNTPTDTTHNNTTKIPPSGPSSPKFYPSTLPSIHLVPANASASVNSNINKHPNINTTTANMSAYRPNQYQQHSYTAPLGIHDMINSIPSTSPSSAKRRKTSDFESRPVSGPPYDNHHHQSYQRSTGSQNLPGNMADLLSNSDDEPLSFHTPEPSTKPSNLDNNPASDGSNLHASADDRRTQSSATTTATVTATATANTIASTTTTTTTAPAVEQPLAIPAATTLPTSHLAQHQAHQHKPTPGTTTTTTSVTTTTTNPAPNPTGQLGRTPEVSAEGAYPPSSTPCPSYNQSIPPSHPPPTQVQDNLGPNQPVVTASSSANASGMPANAQATASAQIKIGIPNESSTQSSSGNADTVPVTATTTTSAKQYPNFPAEFSEALRQVLEDSNEAKIEMMREFGTSFGTTLGNALGSSLNLAIKETLENMFSAQAEKFQAAMGSGKSSCRCGGSSTLESAQSQGAFEKYSSSSDTSSDKNEKQDGHQCATDTSAPKKRTLKGDQSIDTGFQNDVNDEEVTDDGESKRPTTESSKDLKWS